jgi:hypothetical protein
MPMTMPSRAIRARIIKLRQQRDRREGPCTDPVEEASRESFPASDPPSWSALHAGDPFKEKRKVVGGEGREGG